LTVQVGGVRLLFVFDAYQRCSEARDFPLLRKHKRDRLSVEQDPVVIQRSKRRAVRGHVVLVRAIVIGHGRAVLVREHIDNAVDAQRLAHINAGDAAPGNSRRDDAAIGEAGAVELGSIFCGAGNLGAAVDAGCRRTDMLGHGLASLMFLADWTCDTRVACGGGFAASDGHECSRTAQDAPTGDFLHHTISAHPAGDFGRIATAEAGNADAWWQ
jgi:hypothetical protein